MKRKEQTINIESTIASLYSRCIKEVKVTTTYSIIGDPTYIVQYEEPLISEDEYAKFPVCPHCGSDDIYSNEYPQTYDYGQSWSRAYDCNRCGKSHDQHLEYIVTGYNREELIEYES